MGVGCRFYAMNGMYGPLIPNPGSNQCGLIISSHAPCQMERQNLPVDENTCQLAVVSIKHGYHIEPDLSDGNTRFHMAIAAIKKIPNTRTGHTVTLSCGHVVQMFGSLEHAKGMAFCAECFNRNARPKG